MFRCLGQEVKSLMEERHFLSDKEEFQIYKLKETFMRKRFCKSKQGTMIHLFKRSVAA